MKALCFDCGEEETLTLDDCGSISVPEGMTARVTTHSDESQTIEFFCVECHDDREPAPAKRNRYGYCAPGSDGS